MATLTPVQSSQINAIGFDGTTGELLIQFRARGGVGKTYSYAGESARAHYDKLMHPETESIGSYFIRNVKTDGTLKYAALQADDPRSEAVAPVEAAATTEKTPAPTGLKAPDQLKELF